MQMVEHLLRATDCEGGHDNISAVAVAGAFDDLDHLVQSCAQILVLAVPIGRLDHQNISIGNGRGIP